MLSAKRDEFFVIEIFTFSHYAAGQQRLQRKEHRLGFGIWVWHQESQRYLIFWATQEGDSTGCTYFSPRCTKANCARFSIP